MPSRKREPADLGMALLRGGEPLAALEALAGARESVEEAIAAHAARALREGASWGDVGRALGVTRQAARQRYRERAEAAAEDIDEPEDDPPGTWPSAGFMVAPGLVVGVDASEAPAEGSAESSLPDVLMPHVDARFYLSPKAARGVLRRAERAGREVPEPIATTLHALAEPEKP